jgi:hypothetical protein
MENAYSDHTGNQEEFGAIDHEKTPPIGLGMCTK